jgi:hypothetical protein
MQWLVRRIGSNLVDTVLAPIWIAEALSKGLNYCLAALREWIEHSQGNAFVLVAGLGKTLWVLSIGEAILSALGYKPKHNTIYRSDNLSQSEWKRFAFTVAIAATLVGILYFAASQPGAPNGGLILMWLLLYLALMRCLWQARPVTARPIQRV